MYARIMRLSLVLSVCLSLSAVTASAQGTAPAGEAPLTNASVVKLVRAGFRERTVIAIIRSRPARFDLSPDRLIELKKSGVSEKIILTMLSLDGVELAADDEWDDDFFREGGKGRADRGQDSGGTDIFGSSGGSRGRTRSNGGGGGSAGDTQTAGSATVRILRPPSEAGGGAPPKLEKTPTLTNQSVIELVEAGFSEGTIVRRIEQSPVDFDLSPPKLAELRRRRVSEPVIAAMRAAMSDEPSPAQPEK